MAREFNLEHAMKYGCQTLGGREAKVLPYRLKNRDYPLLVVIKERKGEEIPYAYTIDGKFSIYDGDDAFKNLTTTL